MRHRSAVCADWMNRRSRPGTVEKVTTIALDPEADQLLTRAARERGVSRSEFIRQQLALLLEQYRRHPKPRSARLFVRCPNGATSANCSVAADNTAALISDTGALLEYLVEEAPDHQRFRHAIDRARTRYVPGLVLAEVHYFLAGPYVAFFRKPSMR